MATKEKPAQSKLPEINYVLSIDEDKITVFSAKALENLMAYLARVKTEPDCIQSLGGFWVEVATGQEGLVNLTEAKHRILSNLAQAVRLCGVRLVGPDIDSENPIDDADRVSEMIPLLEKKLSPTLQKALAETLPTIAELLAKIRESNLTDQADIQKNATLQASGLITHFRNMLWPVRKLVEITDDAVLPTVGVELVYSKKKFTKNFYEIRTFPLEKLAEKRAEADLK